MQIIIPMSGYGERFRKAGYEIPKPLINVENKPIIAHVIEMFPGENDFTFICNNDHLENNKYKMEEILLKYCPSAKIIGIDPHKLGPINAVSKVFNYIDTKKPIIVNYCDFTCYWNWDTFKKWAIDKDCDGIIPAYKDFHPHSFGKTNYAYLKEKNLVVSDIQEKTPFTSNKTKEYASSGTYYFKSGQLLIDSFNYVFENDLNVNGEYYVSLAYKYLFKKNKKVMAYPLQHFMQWGTPEDLEEYNYWSDLFKIISKDKKVNENIRGNLIIPMAGLGSRFSKEGYKIPKPLINVSGKPMVIQAIDDLPNHENKNFLLRNDMFQVNKLKDLLNNYYVNPEIIDLNELTEGQASTAMIGVNQINNSNLITIGACDNGVIYDSNKFLEKTNNKEIDILVWGVQGYVYAKKFPKMYGWINHKKNKIISVSVKKPLNNPNNDYVVIGTFTFKNKEVFTNSYERMVERAGYINGEYYIDELINDAISLGYNCHLFDVEKYLCWGTPYDLKTFNYWQSCFHKWSCHPYLINLDKRVSEKNKDTLIENCNDWKI